MHCRSHNTSGFQNHSFFEVSVSHTLSVTSCRLPSRPVVPFILPHSGSTQMRDAMSPMLLCGIQCPAKRTAASGRAADAPSRFTTRATADVVWHRKSCSSFCLVSVYIKNLSFLRCSIYSLQVLFFSLLEKMNEC